MSLDNERYDSDISIWLSVDPLAENTPWASPYAYFPFSSNLYHIRGSGTYNIKSVNSYRGFYFGTLNHR